jgi:hypothetical protein
MPPKKWQASLPMLRADELLALVRRYKTEDGIQAKQTMQIILEDDLSPQFIFGMVFGLDQRAALRALSDMCRKKAVREQISPLVVSNVDKLMGIADDKARKTAYRLIGLCAPDCCADKLMQALKNEKTRFVRPSIILALGNTQTPEKHLAGYVVESGEPKHMEEEREALKKALAKSFGQHDINNLRLPEWSALTYIKLSALIAELDYYSLPSRSSALKGALEVRTADIEKLRCYQEALYEVGKMGEFELAAKALDSLGCTGARYRIEAGSLRPEHRRDAIRDVSEGLSRFGYQDNPSAYAFEIRLIGGRMFVIFPKDTRFAYRKKSIPASINPVTAASVMRLCLPYMKANARVLDPFCGSGTMLIERALIKKTDALVGIDISAAAIKAACENRKASGRKFALIHGDALHFGTGIYDEVISNMPFGIRVSGHRLNERLYADFGKRLSKLLDHGGYAFLYTLEKRLLRDSLKALAEFKIIREEVFDSGGLSPSLFIIKKEQST